MTLAHEALVTMLLADYANSDASSKLNILGAGFQVVGLVPAQGPGPGQQVGLVTAPMTLMVLIDVPQRYIGEEFAVTIALHDEKNGGVFQYSDGETQQALRVQQLVKAEKPNVIGVHLPHDFPGRIHHVLSFPNGLPLPPNGQFTWRVEIDGTHHKQWRTYFITAGPPPAPVIG